MRRSFALTAACERLAQRAIDRPRRALAAVAAVVLVAAPGLLRLELRTDGHALVPPDDPAVLADAEVRRHFGLRDPVLAVVVPDHPDGVFNAATLRQLRQLTVALAAVEGIGPGQVMSLATEDRERLDPGTGLSFRSFLDPLPETPEQLALLRQDLAVESAQILRGTLLAEDGGAAAVVVGVPGASLARRDGPDRDGTDRDGPDRGAPDRGLLVRRILAEAERFESPSDRVLVVGAPVAEVLLGRHILEDLALLLPLALVIIAAVLWWSCRRLWGVLLGLLEVAACLVFTFGVMGWLGVPVYLTTAILPVILTTLGLADEVHLFLHYQRRLASVPSAPHPVALRTAMREMARPVVLTSLTTAAGFLAFAVSGVLPVRALGVFAALGVLFAMLFSLAAVPACLALLDPARMVRPPRPRGAAAGRLAGLVPPLWRRGRTLLALFALASLAAAAGAARLEIHDSWLEGFAPGSPFRRATEEVDRRLAGTHVLLLALRFAPPPDGMPQSWEREGPLLDPAAVDLVADLETFAGRQPGVGGSLGLARQLTALAHFWQMARPQRALPADPFDMDRLLRRFDLSRGRHRRQEVIDDALERTVVTVFVRDADYRGTARLMAALRDYERRHLAPRSHRLGFAGDLAVSQAMIPAIVRTQVASLLLSVLGALAVVSLLYRSLAWGTLALLPTALSVLWVFGLMGAAGIPLGIATSMFCAITLGIGIDFAIHLVEGFRRAGGEDSWAAARAALEEVGPAIAGNTLLNVLGFGVLVLSQVQANARLGLVVAAALSAGCLLTLVGLGALLARSGGRPAVPSPG